MSCVHVFIVLLLVYVAEIKSVIASNIEATTTSAPADPPESVVFLDSTSRNSQFAILCSTCFRGSYLYIRGFCPYSFERGMTRVCEACRQPVLRRVDWNNYGTVSNQHTTELNNNTRSYGANAILLIGQILLILFLSMSIAYTISIGYKSMPLWTILTVAVLTIGLIYAFPRFPVQCATWLIRRVHT